MISSAIIASLDNVTHKIFRAAQHFQTLTSELEGYFKTNPGHLVAEQQTNPLEITATFQAKGPIPALIPIILGDCLQNLRSSLDYLVWELVLAANGNPGKKHAFPICETAALFKQNVTSGRLDGVPKDAVTQIESLQPYQLGKDWQKATLWVLNEFNNINKHRRILLTVLRGGESKNNIDVVNVEGQLWARGPMPSFDENAEIGPLPINTERQVQMNKQIFACVTFDEGSAKGREITTCLKTMLQEVEKNVVPTFRAFFT